MLARVPVPKSGCRCQERGPWGHQAVMAGPSVQLLGQYLGRVFGSKGETGPDLYHGKSELQAKQRGAGWAAAVIGWAGVDGEEGRSSGFSWNQGEQGLAVRGAQVSGGVTSKQEIPWATPHKSRASPWLAGSLAVEKAGCWPEKEKENPDSSVCPAPESSVEACSGLPSPHPASSLPQAPARPDAVHLWCREPFIR